MYLFYSSSNNKSLHWTGRFLKRCTTFESFWLENTRNCMEILITICWLLITRREIESSVPTPAQFKTCKKSLTLIYMSLQKHYDKTRLFTKVFCLLYFNSIPINSNTKTLSPRYFTSIGKGHIFWNIIQPTIPTQIFIYHVTQFFTKK